MKNLSLPSPRSPKSQLSPGRSPRTEPATEPNLDRIEAAADSERQSSSRRVDFGGNGQLALAGQLSEEGQRALERSRKNKLQHRDERRQKPRQSVIGAVSAGIGRQRRSVFAAHEYADDQEALQQLAQILHEPVVRDQNGSQGVTDGITLSDVRQSIGDEAELRT